MPKTTRNRDGQTMAQLPGEHDNLTAMMAFMSDEIRQDMPDVEREVAPGVRRGVRDHAASVTTERQQTDDATTAVTKCSNQLLRKNLLSIDGSRYRDAVFFSQRLDPHAARIVDVAGNHPHGSPGRSRHGGAP